MERKKKDNNNQTTTSSKTIPSKTFSKFSFSSEWKEGSRICPN